MALDWGLHSASLINVRVGQMLINLAGMGLAANQPRAAILATHILISSLKEALGSAHLAAVREPLGLFRMDGKCPDGLTLIPLSRGQSLVWDYTCAYTFASSHLEANSKEAGNAAHKAENKKSRHYANLATSGLFIMPVAVETLGSFAPMGLQFIKDLGKRIIEVNGDKRSTMHLVQRLSIAIQRGNAASITGTLPSASSLDEFYYL